MPVWDTLAAPPREGIWVRARRLGAVLAAGALVLTGALTIAGQVVDWINASPSVPRAVSDREFDSAAVPFAVDYLSWDETDRATRQTALSRLTTPGVTVDGWGGTGRQWADSATPLRIARGRDRHAVVTVRLRVLPFVEDHPGTEPATGDPTGAPTDQPENQPTEQARASADRGGPNVASGPLLDAPGWTPGRARWLNLAVPLQQRDNRVVVTATPALVGSPPTAADLPAVSTNAASEDAAFAHDSHDVITTLLHAYGTGDLDYARAAGTTFAGLTDAAELDTITAWRVRALAPDADSSARTGDVTVTWVLSGGAGTLTCTYRVELHQDAGRWYLASIGPPTGAVT